MTRIEGNHRDLLNENLPVKRKRSSTIENNAGGKSSKGWIISENGYKIRVKFSKKQKDDVISSEQELGGKLVSSSVNKCLTDTSMTIAQNSENGQENQIEKAKGDKDLGKIEPNPDRTNIATEKNASFNHEFACSQDSLETNWRNLDLLADMSKTVADTRFILRRRSSLGDIGRDRRLGDGDNGLSSSNWLFGHEEILHHEKRECYSDTKLPNKNTDDNAGVIEGFHELNTTKEDGNHKLNSSKGLLDHEEVLHCEKHVTDNDSISRNEKPGEEHGQHMDKFEKNIQRDVLNIGDAEKDFGVDVDEEHGKDHFVENAKEGFRELRTTNVGGNNEIASPKGLDCHEEVLHHEKHDNYSDTKSPDKNPNENAGVIEGFHELNTTKEDGNHELTSSNRLLDHDEVLHCEKHVPNNDTFSRNEKPDEEHGQHMDKFEKNIQRDVPNIGDAEKDFGVDVDEKHGQDHFVENVKEGFRELRTINVDGTNEIASPKGFDCHEQVLHHENHDNYSDPKLPNKNLDENVCEMEGFHELNTTKEDGNHDFTSSKKFIGHEEVLHCEKPDEEPTDKNMDKFEKFIERDVPNVDDHERDGDVSNESEGHCNKRTDIAKEKNDFAFSRCTHSQCSIATADLREMNVCVKCNKTGKLLVCSSNSCLLMIHESCLGSDASFDVEGRFYCPFCAYSQAISKYADIKKKVSLTRKDFSTFICSGTREEPKKQYRHGIKEHHLEQGDGLHKSELNNKDISEDISCQHKREVVASANVAPRKLDKGKKENTEKKTDEYRSSPCAAEKVSEEENENCGISKHFTRVQKRKAKRSYPAIPKVRRKRIAWMTAEEETLKEGMRRFCNPHDNYIPWKKILEFGADVFQTNRSTVDLKDKWRNICKASPNC